MMAVKRQLESPAERSEGWECILNSLRALTGVYLAVKAGLQVVGGTNECAFGMCENSCIEFC